VLHEIFAECLPGKNILQKIKSNDGKTIFDNLCLVGEAAVSASVLHKKSSTGDNNIHNNTIKIVDALIIYETRG
jgi:hypothetical protein